MDMREELRAKLLEAWPDEIHPWSVDGIIDTMLDAMRSPDEAMANNMRKVSGAGYPYSPTPITPLGFLQIDILWHAGIDAARTPAKES